MDDLNLMKEKQINKVSQYILQLKSQLAQEQQWRQEDQEKLFNEKQQRILIEQRLTEREITLSRKCEQIENLDSKLDSVQKKHQDLESSIKNKGKKGFGFFGKIFSGNEIDQIKMQLNELEEELEIKTEEIGLNFIIIKERLHMQIFDMKREVSKNEELLEKKLYDGANEKKIMMQQCQDVNKECHRLQQNLNESECNLLERQNKIEGFIKAVQQHDDQLRLFREKMGQQGIATKEMQIKLQKDQDDFKRLNQEILTAHDITQFVREQIKIFITRLELSEEKSKIIQDLLKDLKLMFENKFTADIDKEKRKILMKSEHQISSDILQGHLRVSMRLESQDGKLLQVNTIMDDSVGLHHQALDVYERSKLKILQQGKINEILEKKNKLLQDKVNVQETKKQYQGSVTSESGYTNQDISKHINHVH